MEVLLQRQPAEWAGLRPQHPDQVRRRAPALLALFSLVTLLATPLVRDGQLPVQTAAWYPKRHPTFGDAPAAVRTQLRRALGGFVTPRRRPALTRRARTISRRWAQALAHAA